MASNGRDRSLVVIQLSGGNDALNTVVPYNDGLYYDNRPGVALDPESVLVLNGELGLNPAMAPIKRLWDMGKVAIVNGIGYPDPNRSHFRSMDIWHTAEPARIGTEGWLGRAIRQLDPKQESVLTGVNFGRGLPRALSAEGVSVASVGNLDTYGLFPDVRDERMKAYALEAFARMYGTSNGGDAVLNFLRETGTSARRGADVLRTAPAAYTSGVEYAANPIAQSLKSVAQVMFAGIGTRVFYTQHGSFDTHAAELDAHARLWTDVSGAVGDFYDDLTEHGRADDTMIFIFSEFGRRIKDNGTGTDHGSGGVAFVIGGSVDGGLYGEQPSLGDGDQLEGDLYANSDFRSTYSTILERWLGLEAAPIVNGRFGQLDFVAEIDEGSAEARVG